ncbi:hypothetical protein ACFLY4_02610 [Chloroflexota bacterium]
MTLMFRFITGGFTALPAFLFGACDLVLFRDVYYRTASAIMSLVSIGVSVILGLKLPTRMHNGNIDYTWLWVSITGGLAWLIALPSLALLNLTPLCVGQNIGDSTNNLSLCIIYTALVGMMYSPGALVLLTLSSFVSE